MKRLMIAVVLSFSACKPPIERTPTTKEIAPSYAKASEGKPDVTIAVPASQPEPPAPTPRVVLVTVDGWHVKLTERMPVWDEMIHQGSWTLTAEVPPPYTTAVSHAVLYTGLAPEVSGVTDEPHHAPEGDPNVHGCKFRWRPLRVRNPLYDAVRVRGHVTLAAQKGKLLGFLPEPEDGDDFSCTQDGEVVVKKACAALDDDRQSLIILHFKMTDDAGHRHGWLSKEQYVEAEKIGRQLKEVRACLAASDKKLGTTTTLIVTADHGGHGHRHHSHLPSDYLVPWVAVGPGIRADHHLDANVTLADTALVILKALGIPLSEAADLAGHPIDELYGP